MLKRIRIAVLIYMLLFVAAGSYLATKRSTDWDRTLWVDVYAAAADGTAATQDYVAEIDATRFETLELFFAREARRLGVALESPFRFNLAAAPAEPPPALPDDPGLLDAVLYSLSMRLLVAKLNWSSERPTPDIVLLVSYHDPSVTGLIERSGALRKGMIASANVFADARMAGSNLVVIAHEILHTLGATDKYDPRTSLPKYPDGYAEPDRAPRLPQVKAELMGGRIPLGPREAAVPSSLHEVVIGPATAAEIGWRPPAP
jgi:hypothetical protein